MIDIHPVAPPIGNGNGLVLIGNDMDVYLCVPLAETTPRRSESNHSSIISSCYRGLEVRVLLISILLMFLTYLNS